MFCVIFEVRPSPDRWDDYLAEAGALRPELQQVDGFVDNIRYRSLTREGWLLSLSSWRDEKALVRWRTAMRHHVAQERGRAGIMLDYHLRVGEVARDTRLPEGQALPQQRLDETQAGQGTAATLIDTRRRDGESAAELAARLGLDAGGSGLVGWDAFDALLTPGDAILLTTWRNASDAAAYERAAAAAPDGRLRRVRIIRDYGMLDRREAPQYYPPPG